LFPALANGALISSRAIAFNPANGKVYVVDEPGGAVIVIDSHNSATTRVKVGSGPDALAVNRATGNVYVVNSSDGTVSELDGLSNAVSRTFKAGAHPYVIAINEATNKAYVTNTFSNAVAEIDLAAGVTRFLKIGSADNVVTDSRASRAYFIGYEEPNIRILNGATDEAEKAAAQEHLWGMAIDETSGVLYVTASGSGQLLAAGKEKYSVGAIPCAVAVNSETGMIYVVNYGDDSVTVIDGKLKAAAGTIKAGHGPQAIAVDSKANRVYVANTHDDSVTVIDGHTNKVIATVPAGRNPYAITAGSDAGTVYVANFGEPCFTSVRVEAK